MTQEFLPLLNKEHKDPGPMHEHKGVHNVALDLDLDDIVDQKDYWEADFNEDKILFSDDRKRGTSLLWNDFIILSVEYLQWFALIQSLSLRWPWPETWVRAMRWVFAFTLDPWELAKVASNTTYKSVQNFSSDSSLMPFSYWYYLVAWGALLFLLILTYVIVYCTLTQGDDPYLIVKIARMQRFYIILFQVLALPLGVAIARVCHCVTERLGDGNVMYVDNAQVCLSGIQWAYIASALGISLFFYIIFSVWLIRKTKPELIFSHSTGHEAHLQLKETEYVQGLDVVYIVSGFHIFSSFKLRAAYYRPAVHLLKFVVIALYGVLFFYTYYQVMVITVVMLLYLISFSILRPFRVRVFNILLCVNYACLALNLLTGALRSSFDVYTLRSVWFTPTYTQSTLIVVNGVWLLTTLSVLVYLLIHQFNCVKKPIWPSLTSEGVEKLNVNTKRFMRGVLIARHVVEKTMNHHPLFAPAHELSRQIQIINAYCREAEILSDPLQDTLWHLLDELIEVHSQVAPRSLFAESVKDSIRTTANDFMQIMPVFVKRLAQREYDLLLVPPRKRRILLKMYCMGLFLNGRTEKAKIKKLNQPALDRLWTHDNIKKQTDDYLKVLQPERELGPRVAAQTTLTPQTKGMESYSDEDSLSIISDVSITFEVEQMMAGIPSKTPTSKPSTSEGLRSRTTEEQRSPRVRSDNSSAASSRKGSYNLIDAASNQQIETVQLETYRPPSSASIKDHKSASYTVNM